MTEQLIVQSQTPWWLEVFNYLAPHWWGIAAILVAPLVGFAAAQRVRTHTSIKTHNFLLATTSGLVTFVVSFLMWWKGYRDIEGATIVAIITGTAYPIIFTALMGAAKKWWPWGYERLWSSQTGKRKSNENSSGGGSSDHTFFPRW